METDVNVNTSIEDAPEAVDQVEDNGSEVLDIDNSEYSLEDLMNLTEEQYEEFSNDANHKGMRPLHELVKHLPEDARKHLANFRSSYTKKTQELAAERDRIMKELEQERQAIQAERSALYNGDMARKAAQLAQSDEDYDIYDPDGMKKEIQRQAAQMLNEMIKPAQQELAVKQRRMELNQFKSEHPELTSDEYRMPIAQMLQARPELKLEDAYYIVKAKVDSSKAEKERAELAEQRGRKKDAFKKTSSGSTRSPSGMPQFKDAYEAFLWHKQNKV